MQLGVAAGAMYGFTMFRLIITEQERTPVTFCVPSPFDLVADGMVSW
ncbi:hypothetical protein ACWEWG_01010 [Streptomyces sp. NPDC003758]|uniref:Uncharacterized protein n=1 Tax=Streptomyces cynarae TaxID=2981134 RepID=A0ABY6DVP3_9ACTN|nr:hypothetical protein [Streptomyces cynarae]UXY17783.1 hypothetical protein N8I84_02810 [Streptomyces cynarae]